jgi:hypothetical protein
MIRHVLDLTLSEWPRLNRWREDYEAITDTRIENRASSVLNTTLAVDLLPELLPPNDNEAEKLMASLITCALAIGVGILEGALESDLSGTIIWSMKESTILGEKRKKLGRLPTVMRGVRRATPSGQALLAQVEEKIPTLTVEQRTKSMLILRIMLDELRDESIAVKAATALRRSQPGWEGALEAAIKRLGDGRIDDAALKAAWANDHQWLQGAPPDTGFYRVRPQASP